MIQNRKNRLSKKHFKAGNYKPDFNVKPYSLFAPFYDDTMVYLNYRLWMRYINRAISLFSIDCKKVLELASGTGHLAELLSRYYNVLPTDNSIPMIKQIKANFPALSPIKLNMKNFALSDSFDLVVSFNDNINYIEHDTELLSHFNSVFNALNKKGMYIFDSTPAYNIEKNFIGNILIKKNKKAYIRWETLFNKNRTYIKAIIDILDRRKNKIYRETHIQKLHNNELIISLLKKSGFIRVYNYDGFTFYPPNQESEHLHFIALKD